MRRTHLVLTLLLAVAMALASTPALAASQGVIALSTARIDLGEIDQAGGIVSASVDVTNTGNAPLSIHRVSTSCGCTAATMDTSPLAPGETRALAVTFDPMVHPDQTGPITRVVYIQSSDPQQPEVEIDVVGTVLAKTQPTVRVFFNEACQDCGELVQQMYPMLFGEYGYALELHDYINERENRALLTRTNDAWGVPFELQSHIEAFVGERLLIGGHVPERTIRYLLENPDAYDRLLVYQDAMHGEETEYRVWDFKGDIKTYAIDEPITTFLKERASDASAQGPRQGFWGMFGVVTSSAFLDGLNPCAFAVLLFFIGFLFTIKKTRAKIWQMGLVYVAAIYLAYLLIGLGIAQAIIISGAPHLMAKIGAYLVIALGVIQLAGLVFPSFPIKLRIPIDTKATLETWMYKATLPASFIGGFLVGLCTFPCSGGIYVAIIGMLAAQQTALQGTFWMLWYNLIFVAPLLILLALASNPKATERLQTLERAEARGTKLLIGAFMIALGAIILTFFT